MMYTNENRGKIQYTARRNQINDFSGLKYGNITATDTDGNFDIEGDLFVTYEVKYGNASIPGGQFSYLTSSSKRIHMGGGNAFVFEVHHDVEDVRQEVDVSKCVVTRYCRNGKWYTPSLQITAKEATDAIIKLYKPEKAKFYNVQ